MWPHFLLLTGGQSKFRIIYLAKPSEPLYFDLPYIPGSHKHIHDPSTGMKILS